MRPRRRSLSRGCVTPSLLAASVRVTFQARTLCSIAMSRRDRIVMLAASVCVSSSASQTLAKVWRFIVDFPRLLDLFQPLGGEGQVVLCGAWRLFLERVQDVNGVSATSDEQHAKGARLVMNTDFDNPWSDCRHWLPIARRQPELNLVQLDTGLLARRVGKSPQQVKSVAQEYDRF